MRTDHGVDWSALAGSPDALKYNRREVPNLIASLAYVPGRTAVVQAGGNLGVFPKVLARVFDTVWTFEPDPLNFALLKQNAPEPNIKAYQCALGAASSVCTLSRIRRDGRSNAHEGIVHVDRVGVGRTPVIALDSFDFACIDLVYLDIEGFELHALRGAVDLLARCRPVVVVELNKNLAWMGLVADDVRAFLTDHAYQFETRFASDELFVPRVM